MPGHLSTNVHLYNTFFSTLSTVQCIVQYIVQYIESVHKYIVVTSHEHHTVHCIALHLTVQWTAFLQLQAEGNCIGIALQQILFVHWGVLYWGVLHWGVLHCDVYCITSKGIEMYCIEVYYIAVSWTQRPICHSWASMVERAETRLAGWWWWGW